MMRVDGNLQSAGGSVIVPHESLMLARHALGEPAYSQLHSAGNASAAWASHANVVARIHAFVGMEQVHVAVRLLSRAIPSLDDLRLPAIVKTFAQRKRGLILFTGPTGCGKSTTLAAVLDEINRTSTCRIITVEDPIEYRHESRLSTIVQREVPRDVPTFADAVTSALRADPDVIMIGEMRDAETIRAAIVAAETGHLVLATLHTGDAVQTVDRIVHVFEAAVQAHVRAQLAAALEAVVCQRLLPAASGRGRIPAAEIVIANDAVRTVIREARAHHLRNIILTGRDAGMQTFDCHLAELIAQGVVTAAAARICSDRRDEPFFKDSGAHA